MAKKQYESKIATQTKNFINVKAPSFTEDIATTKETVSETPEPNKENTDNEEEIQKNAPVQSTVTKETAALEPNSEETDTDKLKYDLDAMVQAKLQELLTSGKLIGSLGSKAGRPRKYEEKTRIASIRLEESVYEYARQMGRTEFESMTEYINQLIKNDMLSKR